MSNADIIKEVKEGLSSIDKKYGGYGAEMKKLTDTVAEMQKKMAIGGAPVVTESPDMAEMKAMVAYMRGTETKAVADILKGTNGGYLAIPNFQNRVLRRAQDTNPLLAEIDVVDIKENISYIPYETVGDADDVYWVGETEKTSESKLSLGEAQIPVNTMRFKIPVSNTLRDSAEIESIDTYLVEKATRKIENGVGQAILRGDGAKKPLGILNSKGLKTVKSGDASKLTADSIYSVMGAIPEEAGPNAKFCMRRDTFFEIVNLMGKDRAMFTNAPTGLGIQANLMGTPVIFASAMDEVGAGKTPVLYGDFRQAIKGVRNGAMDMKIDEYSSINEDITNFHFRQRFGCAPVMPEYVKGIKIGA